MGSRGCSSCGTTGQISRSRMGPNGYEYYLERCMSCNGTGYIYTPDPPPPPPPRSKTYAKSKVSAGTKRSPNDYVPEPAPPKKGSGKLFEFWFAFGVASAVVWLFTRAGAQLEWWGWLLVFCVPLFSVNSMLLKRPKLKARLQKLVTYAIVLAVIYFIYQASSGGS